MSDIKCLTCGEPWDVYHLQHDLKYDTLELFNRGFSVEEARELWLEVATADEMKENFPGGLESLTEDQIYDEYMALLKGTPAGLVLERFERPLRRVGWEFKSRSLLCPVRCTCCPDSAEAYSPLLRADIAIAQDVFDPSTWIHVTLETGWHVNAYPEVTKRMGQDARLSEPCWFRSVIWQEKSRTLFCALGAHPTAPTWRARSPEYSTHIIAISMACENSLVVMTEPPHPVFKRAVDNLTPILWDTARHFDALRKVRHRRMQLKRAMQPRELVVALGGGDVDGIQSDIEDLGV